MLWEASVLDPNEVILLCIDLFRVLTFLSYRVFGSMA